MSISAVLLAGGESRRMGRDKATLQWCGRPLWEWQIEKLRTLQPERILLSTRSDAFWRADDVDLILDNPPSRGPLSGLAGAIAALTSDHLLVLAIDMPFMTTEHLRLLCNLATEGRGVVPTIDGNAEPLCAIYPSEAGALFQEALRGEDFSLQPIVRKLVALNMVRETPVSGPACHLYESVNTPGDID